MTTNFKTRFWNLGKWYAVLLKILLLIKAKAICNFLLAEAK